MKLKSLCLLGFKTFADRTEVGFADGMTAVVGPNGCGKSNIADALLWVTGEQNPRLLRGADSRDVIFAGTDRRKPVGMAEVRLTLDNSDQSLPLRFAEVAISRRLFRSGESQYLLNNAPCRLKDVLELLMDTGVGRDAYSFVGQSEVDAVLSARAEDRRELFEEAAGIKKYRVKKREAMRKLEQADANLTRIRDILLELGREREPLAEQAEVALRYRTLAERLRCIEIDLLVAEVQKADYELYAARRERNMGAETVARLDADAGRLEAEAGAVAAALAEAEAGLDAARQAHLDAGATVERLQGRLALAAERHRSAESGAAALEAELAELATRASGARRENEQLSAALRRAEADEAARRSELGAARHTLSEVEAAAAELARISADRQGAIRRAAEERAARDAAATAAASRLSEVEERLGRAEADRRALADQADDARERAATARQALEERAREQAALGARRAGLEEARATARAALAAARGALDAARGRLAEREARRAALTELQASGEGFYQGVRAVLRAHREGALRGSYAPVVDLLGVPERLRVAIEVALGGSAQDIVCEGEEEAKAAIEWLKSRRAGRATFLPLTLLRPQPRIAAHELPRADGLLGVAAALVSAGPEHARVLNLLLGRVLIAEDMDAAVRVSRQARGWSRVVTLEGELLTPGGALTGGSLQGKGAHLVGRKGEIDDLARAMPALREEVAATANAVRVAAEQVARLDAELAEVARASADSRTAAAGAERDLHAAEREAERLRAAAVGAADEAGRLNTTVGALRRDLASYREALDAARDHDAGLDDAVAAAHEQAATLDARRDEARRLVGALEVAVGRLVEKRAGLKRSLAAGEQNARQVVASRAARQRQREEIALVLGRAEAAEGELAGEIGAAREALANHEERLGASRARRQALYEEARARSAALREILRRRAEILEEVHGADVRIARLEVRLAQSAERLSAEYGIERAEALAMPEPAEAERGTVNEVARLRREVRLMGAVNTGAVEEYERLTERFEFLSNQQADMEQARESLMAAICEVDQQTRGVFMETFGEVSREFGRLFARLFGGGATQLVLTNPADLLETGIDIVAQPPGKKPQHLSLLSGGERALTAIALLFSFLAVRPSPFVLLDEVDAPLDGVNVEKFVDLLGEFSARTQFVIITHNMTTMEAASHLYGVTMQEPGVSRVLAVRIPPDAAVTVPDDPIPMRRNGDH
ncbi:MAG: chromosome segregation protein SMC [Chthonomonadales bacterium]|nr:chromosome segregation protein SMC [Chthonomonadales bacterium]